MKSDENLFGRNRSFEADRPKLEQPLVALSDCFAEAPKTIRC
jgi:hypothetical protein